MNRKKKFKPVLACLLAIVTLMGIIPVIVPTYAAAAPNVSNLTTISADFSRDPDVYMGSIRVSARRYVAVVDGISYEAFCADPGLRGPENPEAVYELSGEAYPHLKNALKNGFPVNSEWSMDDDMEEKMWWAYVTRVAVAMANHSDRTFTGDAVAIDQAKRLANGSLTANHSAYPPIMVNGVKNTQDTGRSITASTAQSVSFEITHNRKTSHLYNPFRFEWAAGTPAGAKLVVNGVVVATAPNNTSTVYKDNITSFRIGCD